MLEYDFFCLLKKANTLTVAFFHFHKMWICEEPFSLLLTKGPIASLMPGLVILFILLLEHSLEAKWILDIGWFVAFWLQIFSCTCLMLILLSFTMLWSMKGLCGSWCFHVHGHIFFFPYSSRCTTWSYKKISPCRICYLNDIIVNIIYIYIWKGWGVRIYGVILFSCV